MEWIVLFGYNYWSDGFYSLNYQSTKQFLNQIFTAINGIAKQIDSAVTKYFSKIFVEIRRRCGRCGDQMFVEIEFSP